MPDSSNIQFDIEIPKHEVMIGDVLNQIEIHVKHNASQPVKTRVTAKANFGPGPASLLKSKDDHVTSRYAVVGAAGTPLSDERDMDGTAEEGQLVWQTSSRGTEIPANGALIFTLADFRSDTFPGEAAISVLAEVKVEGQWRGKSEERKVVKNFKPTSEPLLHFFRVDPDHILHAGQREVIVSFFATGYETAILFRNNEQCKAWAQADDGRIEGTLKDHPSITSVYRLQLKRPQKGTGVEKPDLFWRTVQVISPGWNRIALPQGSPTRLFVADDFRGEGTERLYGIFYRNWYEQPDRKRLRSRAGLYSSGTGIDAWRLEPNEVPEGMETSPGVVYKNRLWLIGGSAVDPRRKTKAVWCYEKDAATDTMKWNKTNLSFPPGKDEDGSFGHCCVVFADEIWVLGGYDKEPHNDVWRLKKNGEKFDWVSTSPEEAPWSPRCMHTAATVRSADGSETLWVYGGAESRAGSRYNDLWSIEGTWDGGTKKWITGNWSQHTMEGQQTAIVPDPGKPLGSALVAYPEGTVGAGGERLILLGSFNEWQPNKTPNDGPEPMVGNRIASFLFEWRERSRTWESNPVSDGWQQFKGENFSMQALAFNRFLYIYSLDQEALFPQEGKELVNLKLNIRIPS